MKKIAIVLLVVLWLAGLAWAVRAEEDEMKEDAIAIKDDGAESDANESAAKFKDELAPHGRWVQVKAVDYDWVFVPDEAKAPDWKPYVQGGHWLWTDAGWYWQSDYKWGNVCFHYGRWVSTEFGWAWVPGSQWAPAWVCWRECETHYAWAALPPCTHFSVGVGFFIHGRHCAADFDFGFGVDDFCFVPCGAFLEIDLWKHHCRHDECVKVYHKTVIHNTYVYRNGVIHNRPFRKEVVEARTHAKLEAHVVAKEEHERAHKVAHEARVERNSHANHEALKETREARKDAHVVRKEEHPKATEEHKKAQMERNREANKEAIRETHEARKNAPVIRHEQHVQEHHVQQQQQHAPPPPAHHK